jgi:multiple sugar transport system permease protein
MALAKGMHNQLGRANRSENRAFLLLLMPFMGLFFIFTILPIVSSIVLSFTDYDMINTPRFTGLSNYLRMFTTDEVFPVAVKNTLLFSVITGPVSFFLAFLLAWLINEFRPGMRSLLAFLFYAPALIGNVYYIWQVAFSSDSYGYANSLLLSWGLITEPILWFRDVRFSMIIVMIVQLWLSIGISFLADIAGLQNVNPELYEAGAIDGIRTRWHELWYITLPSMKSILLFGAVMQIQATFSISAVPMALAGFPSVNNSVDTLVTHLMDVGTQRYELGYAAAVSVFLFMLMALFRILVGKALDLMGK